MDEHNKGCKQTNDEHNNKKCLHSTNRDHKFLALREDYTQIQPIQSLLQDVLLQLPYQYSKDHQI